MKTSSQKYSEFVRPLVGEQLGMLGLDWEFNSSSGDFLVGTSPTGVSHSVIDLLGGFGSTILGHHPKEAVDLSLAFLQEGRPIHSQLSCRTEVALASELLSLHLEKIFQEPSICHWVNSGSEAIEVALKHSLIAFKNKRQKLEFQNSLLTDLVKRGILVWDRGSTALDIEEFSKIQRECLELKPKLISFRRSYHGRTLGSMGASDHKLKDKIALSSSTNFETQFLDYENSSEWESNLGEPILWPKLIRNGQVVQVEWEPFSAYLAILLEPIQGEGGINLFAEKNVAQLHELKQKFTIPLIVDEIQSGMGRSGKFLASEHFSLKPDLVLLAKGLGAGVAKVGVVAVRRSLYQEDLGRFGATFSEDGFSGQIARWAIEKTSDPVFLGKVEETGRAIFSDFKNLQEEFPDVIAEVRGKGLMLGLEFKSWQDNPSFLLRLFFGNDFMGFLIASYLLNRHQVRVAPSLSAQQVIRIEPSGNFSPRLMEKVLRGFRELCYLLRKGDFASLTQHLWDPNFEVVLTGERDFRVGAVSRASNSKAPDVKVAFLCHFLSMEHMPLFDASLKGIPVSLLSKWYSRGEAFFAPSLFDCVQFSPKDGTTVELNLIGVYESPETMVKAHHSRSVDGLVKSIQGAVDIAKDLGCSVVGLGGLTSVLSRNGLLLDGSRICVTSGNSFTVAISCQALEKMALQKGFPLVDSKLVIVGAAGNIGAAYSRWAAARVKALVLVGRAGKSSQMFSLAGELQSDFPALEVSVAEDMGALKDADYIVSMSNSPQPIIFSHHLSDRVKGILDVATPTDLSDSVETDWPNLDVIRGGRVKVPRFEEILVRGMPVPAGQTLACLAETVVLGLKGVTQHFSFGDLDLKKVELIAAWAAQEGFVMGSFLPALGKVKSPKSSAKLDHFDPAPRPQ